MNKGTAIVRYFENLAAGDPYALGLTAFFVLFVVGVFLLAWKFKVDQRRDDEKFKNRFKKKPTK